MSQISHGTRSALLQSGECACPQEWPQPEKAIRTVGKWSFIFHFVEAHEQNAVYDFPTDAHQLQRLFPSVGSAHSAPYANRDSVSQSRQSGGFSSTFSVFSASVTPGLLTQKSAVATCRLDMHSSTNYLEQIQWYMTGSSPYCFWRLDRMIRACTGSSLDIKTAELFVSSNYHPTNFFCSGLDFAPPTAAGRVFDKETPIVVALHGLTGGTLMKLGGIGFIISFV